MPRMGTPQVKISGSTLGEESRYTLLGPPVKMMPMGSMARNSARGVVQGLTSQYTWHSRTRRAMSWLYWPPKSSTMTV